MSACNQKFSVFNRNTPGRVTANTRRVFHNRRHTSAQPSAKSPFPPSEQKNTDRRHQNHRFHRPTLQEQKSKITVSTERKITVSTHGTKKHRPQPKSPVGQPKSKITVSTHGTRKHRPQPKSPVGQPKSKITVSTDLTKKHRPQPKSPFPPTVQLHNRQQPKFPYSTATHLEK